MNIDFNQVKEHIKLLTGDENSVVTWQVFYDPKGEAQRPDLANHFTGTLADNLDYFKYAQSQLCGVYVGVNVTDGNGRMIENVVGFRGLFADFDGIEEPTWPIEPTFVTKRDETHGHAYWLVSDLTDAEQFTELQKQIAIHSNTDHQVVDPSRVLRVCGFNHYKNPQNPVQYSIDRSGGIKYTVEQVKQAFTLDAVKDAELQQWIDSRNGLHDGTGFDDNPRYITEFRKWCEIIAPPAVIGSGSMQLIRTAGYGYDRGISLEKAQEIMWELYNPRCEPPWQPEEKHDFLTTIQRGYKYATSAPGCKTAVAEFSAFGEVPEPVNGWDANEELAPVEKDSEPAITTSVAAVEENLVYDGRITKDAAAKMLTMLDSKSNHFDLGVCFDGFVNQGAHLIRVDKIFYHFNGKSWDVISDETVKSRIFHFYREMKPVDKFTRGIYNVLCDLVNVREVNNCTWLKESDQTGDDIVVFNNGLLDVSSGAHVLMKHTPAYFSFNHTDYDYQPGSQCPEWHKFLSSVWDDNQELKDMLQEWMGYILTGDIRHQKMAVLYGKSRGGKGVIGDVMRALVGNKNCTAPTLEKINSDAALGSMAKSKLTLIPDAHSVSYNNREAVVSILKAVTGGDPVTYDVKYKDPQTDVMHTKLVMSTNVMPEFLDASGALANRFLIFPFPKSFEGKEDPNLREKLMAEIPGIAQWALVGAVRLSQRGRFDEAQVSVDEKAELREDMFVLGDYVDEMCDLQPKVFTDRDDLFKAYRIWCTSAGVAKPMTKTGFVRTLKNSRLNITWSRPYINGVRAKGFYGISVKPGVVVNMANVAQFKKVD